MKKQRKLWLNVFFLKTLSCCWFSGSILAAENQFANPPKGASFNANASVRIFDPKSGANLVDWDGPTSQLNHAKTLAKAEAFELSVKNAKDNLQNLELKNERRKISKAKRALSLAEDALDEFREKAAQRAKAKNTAYHRWASQLHALERDQQSGVSGSSSKAGPPIARPQTAPGHRSSSHAPPRSRSRT